MSFPFVRKLTFIMKFLFVKISATPLPERQTLNFFINGEGTDLSLHNTLVKKKILVYHSFPGNLPIICLHHSKAPTSFHCVSVEWMYKSKFYPCLLGHSLLVLLYTHNSCINKLPFVFSCEFVFRQSNLQGPCWET